MDAEKLLITWEIYEQRDIWQRELARAEANQNDEHAKAATVAMEQLREVGPLEALRANGDLVHLMVGRRWLAVLHARERGVTWIDIAEALGLTPADAWNGFVRAIEEQERKPGWADAVRARAVLHDRYQLKPSADGWRITLIGRHSSEQPYEWKVAPAHVSEETAQQRAAQLLWDLGRGHVERWQQEPGPSEPFYVAVVVPR